MITIKHGLDRDGWHYATVKHSDFRTYNSAVSDYALGWRKPNYPMPAINGPTYIGKYGIYQSYADLEAYEPQHTWRR